MKKLCAVGAAVALVLCVSGVRAADVSGAGFGPRGPNDAPYIRKGSFSGNGVTNDDTAIGHEVIAAFGGIEVNSSATHVWKVYGYNNGQAQQCQVWGRDPATGTAVAVGNSTSVSGNFNYTISVTFNGTGIYLVSVLCNIPKVVSGAGSYLIGVMQIS